MSKITAEQILVEGAKLVTRRLDFSNVQVQSIMHETKKKQDELLKLKEVKQENLKRVVQL